MTAPANVSDVINCLTGGNSAAPEISQWWKDASALTWAAGTLTSMWMVPGVPGAAATPPSSPAIPTRATAGALRMTNPGGARQRWLRSAFGSSWFGGQIIIYDRLLHVSGLSGTVTSAQTVGTDITRYTGQASIGNLILAEIYTQIGVTARTISCNYLDKDGTSRASGSTTFGSTPYRNPSQCVVIPYNTTAGANSVTRVVDVTLSASTGTAGNFGITIARPLLEISVPAFDSTSFGTGSRSLLLTDVELKADACLGVLFMPYVTPVNYASGSLVSVER